MKIQIPLSNQLYLAQLLYLFTFSRFSKDKNQKYQCLIINQKTT